MDRNHSDELCLPKVTYFIVGSFVGSSLILLFVGFGLVLGLVGWRASKKQDRNACWGLISTYIQVLTAKSLSTFLSIIGVEVRYNSASASPIKFRVVNNKYKISPTDIIPSNVPTFHIEDCVYTIESCCSPVVLPLTSIVLVEYFAVVIVSLMKTKFECNDTDQFCYSVGMDCGTRPLDCTVWEQHSRTSHPVCVDKYPDLIKPILTLLSILGLTIVFISLFSCIFNEKCKFCGPKSRIFVIGICTGMVPIGLTWPVHGYVYEAQIAQALPKLAIFTIIFLTELVLLILPFAVFKESELKKIILTTTGTVMIGGNEIVNDEQWPSNEMLCQDHPPVMINSNGTFTLRKEPNVHKLTFVPAQNEEQIGDNNHHITFEIHSNTHTNIRKKQENRETDHNRNAS